MRGIRFNSTCQGMYLRVNSNTTLFISNCISSLYSLNRAYFKKVCFCGGLFVEAPWHVPSLPSPKSGTACEHIPRLLCRSSHMLQQCRFGFVGCSPLSENPVPTTLSILHWLNTFCCTRQLGTFLFHLGSQSSRLQVAEIYRWRHILQMDKISRLIMLTFFRGRGS